MKIKKILIGICMLILLIQSLNALEDGYLFLGRFVDENENGIEGLSIKIVFEDCISRELTTDAEGEFILVINELLDITYKDDKTKSCVRQIKNNDAFFLLIDKSIIGCNIEEYGEFKTGSSLGAIGTHKIESCIVEEALDYVKPMPGSGGGGGGSADKKPVEDNFIIIGADELDEFKESVEKKQDENIPREEKPLLKMLGLPAISLSQPYIITILLLLLIIDLIVLIYHIRKKEQLDEEEFNKHL